MFGVWANHAEGDDPPPKTRPPLPADWQMNMSETARVHRRFRQVSQTALALFPQLAILVSHPLCLGGFGYGGEPGGGLD